MRFGRLIVGGVAALALVGGGGTVAMKVRDNIQTQQDCATITARHGGNFDPVQLPGKGGSASVLGDSYTEGYLLDDPTRGWAYSLVKAQGWDATLDGIPSTGFVNESACGGDSFKARVRELTAANLLIVQGGVNDFRKDPADVEAAADNVLRMANSVKRVVVIGPAPAPERRDKLAAIDASLAAVAKLNNREYISALGWSDLEFLPDGVHLTEAGHARFAAHVAAALEP
jgi:acyl-CoA thioesterase-1